MKMIKNTFIALIVLILTSCASRIHYDGISVKNWEVDSGDKNFDASFTYFSGKAYQVANFDTKDSEIFITTELEKGNITVYVSDEKQKIIWISGKLEKNKLLKTTLEAKKGKNYKVYVDGNKATGKFNINWN